VFRFGLTVRGSSADARSSFPVPLLLESNDSWERHEFGVLVLGIGGGGGRKRGERTSWRAREDGRRRRSEVAERRLGASSTVFVGVVDSSFEES